MKKLLTIFLVLVLSVSLYGCFNHQNAQQIDTNEYTQLKDLLIHEDYHANPRYKIKLAKQGNRYTITISNPAKSLRNLQVLALPLNDQEIDMLPNFNIIEKPDLSSFYKQQKQIRINYFSEEAVPAFKVLLKYQLKQHKYHDIIKLTLN